MRVLSFTSGVISTAAFFCNTASSVVLPRAELETTTLTPWVSLDASGTPVATITPVLTTVNGIATTVSAAPASLTATTTSKGDASAAISGAIPTSPGGGSFDVCYNMEGGYAPFCKPSNGSDVYIGETYYVTWDTRFFTLKNASVLIQANYVNTTGGVQAFQSPPTVNAFGFYAWTIDKEWLRGKGSNNLTLYIIPLNPIANKPTGFAGPVLRVTNRPENYYHPGKTKAPKGQDIYIALPTVFGFIILVVVGGFFWNKKQRQIGLGNVTGRRGYGVRKSRTQRLGLGKNKGEAIRLREQELASAPQYTDTPQARLPGHARRESDAARSLARTPTDGWNDYFRDETDHRP